MFSHTANAIDLCATQHPLEAVRTNVPEIRAFEGIVWNLRKRNGSVAFTKDNDLVTALDRLSL